MRRTCHRAGLLHREGSTGLSIRMRTICGAAGRRNWNKEAIGERLSVDERTELTRIRRENKELRMEKEILKKASAFCAKEMEF